MSGLASSLLSRLQGMVGQAGPRYSTNDAFNQGTAALHVNAADRRLLDKTFKLMDSVVKLCQNHRLNLKNSPPFILDILPDMYQQLTSIFLQDANILRDNVYLQVYLNNVQDKCKQVLKLFKTMNVFDEHTQERRNLTKLSLIFNHMLSELKAEFPGAKFVGENFRITKREAEVFWKASFKGKTLVRWDEFQRELEKTQPVSRLETLALKSTVDLTCNEHVSNFEFDVFTRLFYPWKTLIRNWQLLTTAHPGYVAFLTYDEVKKKLDQYRDKPGSYVFRLSCTRLGQWAIGYVAPDKKIYQTIPQNKSLIQALHEGSREGFYLYPNGRDKDVDLSNAIDLPPADKIQVTPEQYQIYCEMGTTFELCKICDDNDKNIKLEPCGHLLCQPCLTSWQESENGATCPFCRYEIKGTNKILIDSFQPPKAETPKRQSSVPAVWEGGAVQTQMSVPSIAPPPVPTRKSPGFSKSASNSARNSLTGNSMARHSMGLVPSLRQPSPPVDAPPTEAPPPLPPPLMARAKLAEPVYMNVTPAE